MCTGFVSLYVQENEEERSKIQCLISTQVQHRQDLEFIK